MLPRGCGPRSPVLDPLPDGSRPDSGTPLGCPVGRCRRRTGSMREQGIDGRIVKAGFGINGNRARLLGALRHRSGELGQRAPPVASVHGWRSRLMNRDGATRCPLDTRSPRCLAGRRRRRGPAGAGTATFSFRRLGRIRRYRRYCRSRCRRSRYRCRRRRPGSPVRRRRRGCRCRRRRGVRPGRPSR